MSTENKKPKKVIPIAVAEPDEELVSLYAAHQKIYPRSVSGVFSNWRWIMVWVTQIIFYGLPWLEWGQRQAVLFDLSVRRFYIFGLVLYPQDFIYLTGLMIVSALSLFLFTAVAGRLWCGYACPQTVYTEIFLWIEKKLEGDRSARKRRDEGPMTFEKFARKAGNNFYGLLLLFGLALPLWATLCRCVKWLAPFWVANWPPGNFSGSSFMALPLTVTLVSCASRYVNTCAPMRGSRAPCSTRTR